MPTTNGFVLNRYETWELDTMLAQIERPNPWLLETFFPREKLFTSETIEFDLIDRGRRMAPFVSPLVAGKPMRREGMRTKQFRPAYIKPTALVTPSEAFTRMPGEGYGGRMSAQQRFDLIVAEHLALHEDAIKNRMEWMAAQALVYSAITISGEDYQTVELNFGRDAALTLTQTGLPTAWSQMASTPMEDIEHMSLLVRQISKGAVVTDLVMDGQTWQLLRFHSNVTDLISAFFRRGDSAIDAAPRNEINQATLVGTLNGRMRMWVYDAYIQDDTGTDQPLIPPFNLLGLTGQIEGTQYYGAIMDLDAQIEARKTFSKSKVMFDPSGLELITQSAPLVAPKRVNAMFRIICN